MCLVGVSEFLWFSSRKVAAHNENLPSISPAAEMSTTVDTLDDGSPSVIGFAENFDGVTVPQLPANWISSQSGSGTGFVTQTIAPDTPPNAIFTTDPSTVGLSEIQSPPIRLGGNSPKLIFRHAYSLESGFDGGVLEIKIGNGAYQDIRTPGGTFVSGGYTSTLSSAFMNPLGGRQAWSGTTGSSGTTYVTTEVALPPSAYRQVVQFKWRFGADNSIAGVGWRIDSVLVTNAVTGDNTTAIVLPLSGPASPYPSEINLTGLEGTITDVEVNIQGLTHSVPDDVDLLLASPSGKCVLLMSDVGGNGPVSNLDLTLDDAASASLPDSSMLQSGSFRPTDFEPGDVFPGPPPCVSTFGTLAGLFNSVPNGSWKLYAVDDTGSNSGTITNGWSLVVNTSLTAITIHSNGIAEPYPSGVVVSGVVDRVSKVTVALESFSHAFPDDVDLMLVGPTGRKIPLMSDAGGNSPVNGLNITFDDTAPAFLPDDAPFVAGSYRPADFEPGDVFPSPAPPGSMSGRMLAVFNGSDPNGQWNLFLVDDSGNNAGTINAWTLDIQTAPDLIDIHASGVADPYPAGRAISGLPGNVTRATVTIPNFSHTVPDDVDILLEAPNGRRIVLMSDAGGNTEVGRLDLIFDDDAASLLPDTGPLASGTYKPTDYEAGDTFPPPAPSGPTTGPGLSSFYGSAPNGVWKLYVVDDTGANFGSIAAAWNLNLQTSISACAFTISPSIQAFPVGGGSGGFSITMPVGCSWNAVSDSSFLTISSAASGSGNGVVTFNVGPNTGPPRTAEIEVSNGVTTRTFQIQQASGCPFAPLQSIVNIRSSGGDQSMPISAGSTCTWQAISGASWLQITSGQQTGNGTLSFSVQPNPTSVRRQTTITLGAVAVVVNQAGQAGAKFDFDGDARTDIAVYRPSTGSWWIQNSGVPGTYAATPFGLSTDRLAPADFDGDRKTDIGVYRDGTWYLLVSGTNTIRYDFWGIAEDLPVPEDFDGDGKADVAVYRPSESRWYIHQSTDSALRIVLFGVSTDHPVPADYDGDGLADVAIYREGSAPNVQSHWAILNSSSGITDEIPFGLGSDIPTPADYDGDGRTNVAVFRPSIGTWYTSLDPATNYGGQRWGMAGDVPAAGDYDGDGKADFAVFRVDTWYILHRGSGAIRVEGWGTTADVAVPSSFLP